MAGIEKPKWSDGDDGDEVHEQREQHAVDKAVHIFAGRAAAEEADGVRGRRSTRRVQIRKCSRIRPKDTASAGRAYWTSRESGAIRSCLAGGGVHAGQDDARQDRPDIEGEEAADQDDERVPDAGALSQRSKRHGSHVFFCFCGTTHPHIPDVKKVLSTNCQASYYTV
jgi:hypothetical protein